MTALRKIGVRKLDKIRNEVIRERTGCTSKILPISHERQHRWLGHVLRMDKRIARTVLHGKIDGKRKQGRPKATWADTVEERSQHTLRRETNYHMIEQVRKSLDLLLEPKSGRIG